MTGRRIVTFEAPIRGDVAVFKYPGNPELDYVKRVIGVPGDLIEYVDKRLRVNGREMTVREVGLEVVGLASGGSAFRLTRYEEQLDEVAHAILLDPQLPTYVTGAVLDFEDKQQCRYHDAGFSCKVPEGKYFVMGDNRDHSADSRYWGFVAEDAFVGRAFVVWYSFSDAKRAGVPVQ